MRLDDLFQPTTNDIILREAILTSKSNQEREYITELLPLIPLALWGAGAAWTAYDAYQAKKAYDRGEITGADLGKMVGTDIAITLAAGGVGKVLGKGWRFAKKIYKSKKAAKEAEKAAVTSAAVAVNKTVKNQVADAGISKTAATATVAKTSKATVDKLKGKVDDKLQKAADDAAHKKNMANTLRNQKINKQGDFAPPTTSLVAKNVGKKQADNWAPAAGTTGKATSKVIKKNADDVKKKKKGKKWRMGGAGGVSSMHDTNFSQFVDKYAKY